MKQLRWELVKEDIVPTVNYQCVGLVKLGYKQTRRCNNYAPWYTHPDALPFRCYRHKLRKEDT